MAKIPTYKPAAHTSPETAKAGNYSVAGLSPGATYAVLNDGRAAAYVFVPSGTHPDGFPGKMIPVATSADVT